MKIFISNPLARGNKEERTFYMRDLRRKWGWTQKDMADFLNISKRTYEAWENKEQTPAAVTALLDVIEQNRLTIS